MEINGELEEKRGGRSFGDGIAEVGGRMMDVADRFMDILDRMAERYRPSVITLAVLVYLLVKDFGDKLLAQLASHAELPPEVHIAILSGLIGTGIGGLIAVMMRLFESPSVPVESHERIVQTQEENRARMLRDFEQYMTAREKAAKE